MKEIDHFMEEFYSLLKKYYIDDTVLMNSDDDQMGFARLFNITNVQMGKFLLIKYSGRGEVICPCCAERESETEKNKI